MPNEAFLQWYPKLLGSDRQIGLKNFGAVLKVSYILCYNWTNQSIQAYRWFRDDYITEDNCYTSRNLLIIKWWSKADFFRKVHPLTYINTQWLERYYVRNIVIKIIKITAQTLLLLVLPENWIGHLLPTVWPQPIWIKFKRVGGKYYGNIKVHALVRSPVSPSIEIPPFRPHKFLMM